MARELLNNRQNFPNEHASIPGEATLAEKLLGHFGVGFFAKAFHFEGRVLAIEPGNHRALAAFDIAVRRASPCWLDADRDKPVGRLRAEDRIAQHLLKRSRVLNELVGRKHQHYRIGIFCGDEPDAKSDRRSRVAFGRLGKHIGRRQHRCGRAHCIDLLFIGEHEDLLDRHQAIEATDGLLEQRAGSEEIEQLLGPGVATQGPEARAGSAGKDQRIGVVR